MFNEKQFKAMISRRFLLFVAVLVTLTTVLSSLLYVKSSFAQSDTDPNEYIFEVLLLPGWRISEAIFAYELNGKYYLPLEELSNGFEFFSEVDLEMKYAEGFASVQENSFIIDGSRNEIVVKGERESLAEDAILESDFVATDDLYVQLEVLNQIWPVDMRIELSSLTIISDAEEELSFMRDQERKERQEMVVARREKRERDSKKLPRRENEYQWLGKPVVDYQTNYKFDADTDKVTGSNIFTGIAQVAKMQAEFSGNFRVQDGSVEKPGNIRLKFSRRSAEDENLWVPGLRKLEAGDVSLRQRSLIANSSTGRGVTISNDNQSRGGEFDYVTIEGVGPPNWEIELYNNNELVDFGEVPDNGLYIFEDVVLGYGNNEIRIVLFGPQGQVKEEVRNYTAGGNMLKPNEFRYHAGFIDTDRPFILLDNEPRTTPRGISKSLGTAYGVNKYVTLFSNYSEMPTQNGDRTYMTAGAAVSTPIGLMEAEAYNQAKGGNAFSLDYITKFLGFRFNLTTSFFNDFESEKAGFGTNKKKTEFESQLSRSVKLFSLPLGLRFNTLRTRRESGATTTDFDSTQTLTHSGLRLSHTTRTRLTDDEHSRTTGSFTSTLREGQWQFRGGLNYSLYPESKLVSGNGEVRYKTEDKFQAALGLSHSFDTSDYRVSSQIGYDFKKFLGTFESAYKRNKGWEFVLRTTTSLHSYTDNDRYTFSSASKRQSAPVRARVFLDKNADGIQGEDEETIENVKLAFGGGRSKDKTDENGYVIADLPYDKLINVSLDTASLEDPYFVPAYEGFSTVPIKGKMIDAVFPVIETGSIEGTAYRQSNDRFVPGLEIHLVNAEGEIVATIETGFDGFYVFEFVPPGVYSIIASDRHDVDLVENSATVAVDDLYVYGHDIFINDMNIALIEERVRQLEPAAGIHGIETYGPMEMFGPQRPQAEMTGSHGQDALLGLEQLAAASAVEVPAVLPRLGAFKLSEESLSDEQQQEEIDPLDVQSPVIETVLNDVSHIRLNDMRFKMHNGKARLVAEFSDHIEYEVLNVRESGSVKILVKDVSIDEGRDILAQQLDNAFETNVVQQGGDIIIEISARAKPIALKMSSVLPALDGGAGARLMIDVQ